MRIQKLCCWLAVMILVGCGQPQGRWHARQIDGLLPDLQFELTSETGNPLKAEQLRGKVTLVFFGFSHCMRVCPMTLTKLSQALARLPGEQREQVTVLFVSVDPARDTPARLTSYTEYFGPAFIGVTGDQRALRKLAKRYRVTYGYGRPDAEGNYQVSHSNGVYVFDQRNRARLLIDGESSVADISEDIGRLLM